MQLLVFELIVVLMLKEIPNDGEELVTQSLRTGKGAGQVGGDHINSTMNVVLVKNLDVPLEIGIQHRKLVDGNIEHGGLVHDVIVFVAERHTGHHHVVHGNTQFSTNGICGFAPFTAGFGHEIAPATERFGVRTNNPIGAGRKNGMQNTTAASFLGAGHFTGADFETWIKAAIGSQSLGIWKSAWRSDVSKPSET